MYLNVFALLMRHFVALLALGVGDTAHFSVGGGALLLAHWVTLLNNQPKNLWIFCCFFCGFSV